MISISNTSYFQVKSVVGYWAMINEGNVQELVKRGEWPWWFQTNFPNHDEDAGDLEWRSHCLTLLNAKIYDNITMTS